MKVSELIAALQRLPPDLEVRYRYPSHDYWRTWLAGEIDRVEEAAVKWSAYHEAHETLDHDEDGAMAAVILR